MMTRRSVGLITVAITPTGSDCTRPLDMAGAYRVCLGKAREASGLAHSFLFSRVRRAFSAGDRAPQSGAPALAPEHRRKMPFGIPIRCRKVALGGSTGCARQNAF